MLSANSELLGESYSTRRCRSYFPTLHAARRTPGRGYALEREIARYDEHLQRLLDRSAATTHNDLHF